MADDVVPEGVMSCMTLEQLLEPVSTHAMADDVVPEGVWSAIERTVPCMPIACVDTGSRSCSSVMYARTRACSYALQVQAMIRVLLSTVPWLRKRTSGSFLCVHTLAHANLKECIEENSFRTSAFVER